jgi:progressive ankylosis protein
MKSRYLDLGKAAGIWWPLAASWLLMSVELPATSAVIARLSDPEITLAAFGSVVFPIAIAVEAPIIMLLTASTALCRDWQSYLKIRFYMMSMGAFLTALHALIAFTPLFDFLVGRLMGIPGEIMDPARTGLQIMLLWTWAIAYRRFNQGVLIRFGRSRIVSAGTLIRLSTVVIILAAGGITASLPGIVVAGVAIATGVLAEAVYIGYRVRPLLDLYRNREEEAENAEAGNRLDRIITITSFTAFYLPLAMTSILRLAFQPVVSSAVSRSPMAMESLAVWPVLYGLFFILRCSGYAFQEVAVTLLDRKGAMEVLGRFAAIISLVSTAVFVLIAVTPLGRIWFFYFSGLSLDLSLLGEAGIWFGCLLPGLSVYQSWFQARLVHLRKTRPVTESVILYIVSSSLVLLIAVLSGRITGLFAAILSLSVGVLVQTGWLWWRCRSEEEKVADLQAIIVAEAEK